MRCPLDETDGYIILQTLTSLSKSTNRTRRLVPRKTATFRGMCEDILNTIPQFCRPDRFWYVFIHTGIATPHVHFVHDCFYSNRFCKMLSNLKAHTMLQKTIQQGGGGCISDDSSDEELSIPLQHTSLIYDAMQ